MKLLNIHRNYILPFSRTAVRTALLFPRPFGISRVSAHTHTLLSLSLLFFLLHHSNEKGRASMSMSLSSVSCLLPVPSNCILRFVRNSERSIHAYSMYVCMYVRTGTRKWVSEWERALLFDQMRAQVQYCARGVSGRATLTLECEEWDTESCIKLIS